MEFQGIERVKYSYFRENISGVVVLLNLERIYVEVINAYVIV